MATEEPPVTPRHSVMLPSHPMHLAMVQTHFQSLHQRNAHMCSCRERRRTRTGPHESAGSPVSRPPRNPALRSHNVFAGVSGRCACTCRQKQKHQEQGEV